MAQVNGVVDNVEKCVGKRGAYVKVKIGREIYFAHGQLAGSVEDQFNPGDSVSIEFTASEGGFKNIKTITPAKGGTAPAPASTGGSGNRPSFDGRGRDESIERQVVFKGAIELAVASPQAEEEVIAARALKIWDTIQTGMKEKKADPTVLTGAEAK